MTDPIPENTEQPEQPEKTAYFTKPVKAFIRREILAGATNEDIRRKLKYQFNIDNCSNQRLTRYRQSKQVTEALTHIDVEWTQAGLMRREARLAILHRTSMTLLEKMYGKIPGEPDFPGSPVRLGDFLQCMRELRDNIKMITILREGGPGAVAGDAAVTPTVAQMALPNGFFLGMLNDALEAWLNAQEQVPQVEVEVEGAAEPEPEPAGLIEAGDNDRSGD